jgi:hypothetical protein
MADTRGRSYYGAEAPLQAQADEWRGTVIGAQIRGDAAFASAMAQSAFAAMITQLPSDIVDLSETLDFPYFRVQAWKTNGRASGIPILTAADRLDDTVVDSRSCRTACCQCDLPGYGRAGRAAEPADAGPAAAR